MCCCCKDECYNQEPATTTTRCGEGEKEPLNPRYTRPCTVNCGIWTVLFYLAIFCMNAGIPCWASGSVAIHFHTSARDNFAKTECLHLNTTEVWGYDDDCGCQVVQRLDYKYMFVPNTGVNDTVYTIKSNDETGWIIRTEWRTDTVNATYMWAGNGVKWGGVETTEGWLKTEWCWVQVGELEPNQDERKIIWSPIKALESYQFQVIRWSGMGLLAFGLVVLASYLCTPAVTLSYPLCFGWARSTHVAIASTSLLLGLTTTLVIGAIVEYQFKPFEGPATVMWVTALVLMIWTICVSVLACCCTHYSMRRHNMERLGLLARPVLGNTEETTAGETAINAV